MKIFTTALIAFCSMTYGLTARANYNHNAEYPTGRWSIAVVGCASDAVGLPPREYDIYSAVVVEVTVTSDTKGRLTASVSTLVNRWSASLPEGWQTYILTPVGAEDYAGQPPLDYDNFSKDMWTAGPNDIFILGQATATVRSASELDNTPGVHTRVGTVELDDYGRSCAIRTSKRAHLTGHAR